MRRIIRDGVFLVVWLAVQFSVNEVKELLNPHGFDLFLFWVFQVVFGIATLVDVLRDIVQSWGDDDEP